MKEVIQELLNISGTTQNKIFQDSDIVALRLCYIIEKVASHGLMDRGVFSKTTIWDYVQNLGKCLPGGQSAVDKASKEAKTPIGKGRVFIRVSLNECSLADYMSSLIWNESLTRFHSILYNYIGIFYLLFSFFIKEILSSKFNFCFRRTQTNDYYVI